MHCLERLSMLFSQTGNQLLLFLGLELRLHQLGSLLSTLCILSLSAQLSLKIC